MKKFTTIILIILSLLIITNCQVISKSNSNHYILCIDISKSMVGKAEKNAKKNPSYIENIFPNVQQSLKKVIESKNSKDEVTLILFGENVKIELKNEIDKNLIFKIIDDLKPNEEITDTQKMYKFLFEYVNEIKISNRMNSKNGTMKIMIFSDGMETKNLQPNKKLEYERFSNGDIQYISIIDVRD